MNTDALNQLVGIHVGVGGLSTAGIGCPAGNEVGSLLLLRVLESALARDGIERCAPTGRLGPLNDCIIARSVFGMTQVGDASIPRLKTKWNG
jgi:hypothetical protein